MQIVYSENHHQHAADVEFFRGSLVSCYENPARADVIASRIREVGLGPLIEPSDFGIAPILRVHDERFVEFLTTAYHEWSKVAGDIDAFPHAWMGRGLGSGQIPIDIHGKLGYYAADAGTPISQGTWPAALLAAQIALTAQSHVWKTGESAFALSRPPGHHAARDVYGGYCFLNQAAIAAQAFLDQGAKKVAIVDVDFHHGNGTQSIFYDRADVLFVSLHGDPDFEYPYFLGHRHETGNGEGAGFNLNVPLSPGTTWDDYQKQLAVGLQRVHDFAPEYLVVSLGVDTFEGDPISQFRFGSHDFVELGQQLSKLGYPTLFIMEGGYAIDELGVNVANVLSGFES